MKKHLNEAFLWELIPLTLITVLLGHFAGNLFIGVIGAAVVYAIGWLVENFVIHHTLKRRLMITSAMYRELRVEQLLADLYRMEERYKKIGLRPGSSYERHGQANLLKRKIDRQQRKITYYTRPQGRDTKRNS